MSDELTKNLGDGAAVDINFIEQSLASLWASTGTTAAVIRACSCNLLVFVRNRQLAGQISPVLTRVAEWHPNRSIVASVEPDATLEPPDIHSWINAYCSVPKSGGPHVCCEAITIAAREKARRDLPDTVSALLVPNLPVYLYWRSFRLADKGVIERLARFSNLLIVDSHQSREDPEARLNVLQLLVDRPAGVVMRDLNWGRITAWRDLIAQFFDSAATNMHVREISEIEITRNLSAPGSIPTRTLLLTGWLASSLGWQRTSAKRSGDCWYSSWQSGTGEVRVTFTGTESEPGQVPGISAVTLRTRSNAEFTVSVEHGSQSLTAVSQVGGSRIIHSVPEDALDEASLLVTELSWTGEDQSFKAALAEAYALERAFRN